jgi:hypothetical protein
MLKQALLFTLCTAIYLNASPDLFGQSQEKKYAVMMLNFAKGMQWPENVSKGNFIIGIYEYPPLASELSAYVSSTKLGARSIEIKEIGSPDEIEKCHMLFIPAYKTKRLPEILTAIENKPVLIISNKMDYAKKGAGINFVLVDGILKYEINSKAIEKRGVKISANLKGMGIAVE